MQWWNDFMDWFGSNDGQTVLFSAIIPFVAILVAGIVAAAIGRGSTRRLLTLNDRENRIAAVATLIGAARRASVWNTLGAPEQQHADHIASEADVRVRLLAVPGSGLAADWAAHEISAMKRNSVSFSFQAEQSLIEFRERMVQWQAKPSRAKKLFKNDLDLWSYEDSQATKDIISQQQAWAATQVAEETGPISTVKAPRTDAASERTESAFAPSRPPAAVSISSLADDSPRSSSGDKPELVEPAGPTRPVESARPAESTRPVEPARPVDSARPVDVRESAAPPPRNSDDDRFEDEGDRRLGDAAYSPVNASTVTKRINPPKVGDDGRKY